MLNRQQLNAIFYLFVAVVAVLTLVEVYLLYRIAAGQSNWVSAASTLINTSFIAAIGKVFIDISKKNFLDATKVPIEAITELVHEHVSFENSGDLPKLEKVRLKMESTLRLARQRLEGWCSGNHFEFCVFIDKEYPLMFAYMDSTLHHRNRSIANREGNPKYYLESNYEAVKLLQSPQSQPHYIPDTHDEAKFGYSFARTEQKSQIRSTLLMCTDTDNPAVVVFSSNSKDAFDLADRELMSFIRLVVELIRQDFAAYGLPELIRNEKPKLFES